MNLFARILNKRFFSTLDLHLSLSKPQFLHKKTMKIHNTKLKPSLNCLIIFCLFLCSCLLLFNSFPKLVFNANYKVDKPDLCAGRYIYIHNISSKFNTDLISNCQKTSRVSYTCESFSNFGMGPLINNNSWYATDQFMLEIIFHNKLKNYTCLTTNSSLASAIYVPYYAGLDIARYLWGYNTSIRDSGPNELVQWFRAQPEWARMNGKDHFIAVGRITWDFRRVPEYSDWGNTLLLTEELKNMTALSIESAYCYKNDFAVPYPTYFHPSSKSDITKWQKKMRRMKRRYLFSFAGGPRPDMNRSIRGELINQCIKSRKCKLLECKLGMSKCNSASSVMRLFQRSVFCLQPQGDSCTRRSVFDTILAGCIPVFFHPCTAYTQYVWYLPKDYRKYSVFIDEYEVKRGKVWIEEVLKKVSGGEVVRMREEVLSLIPRLVYNHPGAKVEGVKDAFDIAIDEVLKRVDRIRNGVLMEVEDEQKAWKYKIGVGANETHEWDHFFPLHNR